VLELDDRILVAAGRLGFEHRSATPPAEPRRQGVVTAGQRTVGQRDITLPSSRNRADANSSSGTRRAVSPSPVSTS